MSDVLSVVISVGRGAGLQPPLPGAYEGHREFKAWAQSQGHDIEQFTDEHTGDFNAIDIAGAITPRVDQQSLSTLWIYFAGHGECSSLERDYWLLKRDGAGQADVIDVNSTVKLARRCGIPRIIIVSDACRTTGDALSMALYESATAILPPRNVDSTTPSVDRLFAAGPSTAALEVREREEAARSYGVFSKELMRALRGEVPSVQKRSVDGDKMVVTPTELRLHLESQVPSAGAAIPGGYAQRPDCIFESNEPLAEVGDVPIFDVHVRTEFLDGDPAADTTIKLLLHRFATWEEVGQQSGPDANFPCPSGLFYKATAEGPYEFIAEQPMPLFELHSQTFGRFVARDRNDAEPESVPFAVSPTDDVGLADFAITRVLDEQGGIHPKAPKPGVYRVVSYDPVNRQMGTELQEFAAGELLPKTVPTPVVREDIESQLIEAAQTHGRRTFETRVGLTLLGLPESRTPEVAADPGLLDDVFVEDGRWNIRGTRSGNLAVRLGEHCLPVPMFQGLVGTIRVADASSTRPTISDLSYAPADGTDYDYDLVQFDDPETRISGSARDELDALQMIVTRCARNGFFEVAIDDAAGLAGRIRRLKHHNPIFGVIGAYAYDQLNRLDQIVDMMDWFVRKGQAIPYDIALLANFTQQQIENLVGTSNHPVPHVAPAWPMLTQGWLRLPAAHLEKFPILQNVRDSLVPGFWTTIAGSTGNDFFNQVNEGKLTWI